MSCFVNPLLTICLFSKSLQTASINIDSLDNQLRHFVIQYERGYRQASELVSKEALQVRQIVIRESGRTEIAIRNHITQTSTKSEQRFRNHIEQTSRNRLQEKFLQSLKYPSMNERANQIEDAHTHTFRWLFADEENLSYRNEDQRTNGPQDAYDEYAPSEVGDIDVPMNDEYEWEEESPERVWSSLTDWLQSDLNIYWIMGKPGSGKSTLAKFIISEPRTKIALEKWRRDVILASHYFWRPGALLQRNIKGMLCSIIYQLVNSAPNALEYASVNVDGLDQKDADTDWSVAELKRLCLGLIRHCGKPLCLLVDGLDECGPEDDHQDLLDTLERMKSQDVKIIVSSRNEPVFERRFRHEPQLRMQDLTGADLRTYATDKLRPEFRKDVFFSADLAKKSEGVFLWLVLAVRSVNRGLDNGESLKDVRKRMESLPKRLMDLYKDMWERLDDDGDLYLRSAALYFKLVMAANGTRLRCVEDGFSIVEMMLASFEDSHHAFAKSPIISAGHLLEECRGFRERVEVRCAGLLGVTRYEVLLGPGGTPYPTKEGMREKSLGDTESALLEYTYKDAGFRFIHRSAHDFLVDTIEGQDILRHDETSSEDLDLHIFKGNLRATELVFLLTGRPTKTCAVFYRCPPQDAEVYLNDLSGIADVRGDAVRLLFSRCIELFSSSGLMFNQVETLPTRMAAFFGVAARWPNLNRYSTSIIESELGSEIRSEFLFSALTIPPRNLFNPTRREYFLWESRSQGYFPWELARWLLRLPEIDVNLECSILHRKSGWIRDSGGYGGREIGPRIQIKESPFTMLLGFGLRHLEWRPPIQSLRRQTHMSQFFLLLSDFAFKGADFHSTVFLAFRAVDYSTEYWTQPGMMAMERRLYHFFEWEVRDDGYLDREVEGILCVVALQAATIIQRMLANLLNIGLSCDGFDEGYLDLYSAISFLRQRCQEYNYGPSDRILGFLQPCGNLNDIPYRQISEQDSTDITEILLAVIFESRASWEDLGEICRQAIMRSPFSSIGFRDYLRDTGCFDEFAAHKILLQHQEGT